MILRSLSNMSEYRSKQQQQLVQESIEELEPREDTRGRGRCIHKKLEGLHDHSYKFKKRPSCLTCTILKSFSLSLSLSSFTLLCSSQMQIGKPHTTHTHVKFKAFQNLDLFRPEKNPEFCRFSGCIVSHNLNPSFSSKCFQINSPSLVSNYLLVLYT